MLKRLERVRRSRILERLYAKAWFFNDSIAYVGWEDARRALRPIESYRTADGVLKFRDVSKEADAVKKFWLTVEDHAVETSIPKNIRDEIKLHERLRMSDGTSSPPYDFLACDPGGRTSTRRGRVTAKSFFWVLTKSGMKMNGGRKHTAQSCIPVKIFSMGEILDSLPKMDSQSVFDRCMRQAHKEVIRGTDVITHSRSPFALYCDHFVNESKMDPPRDDILALARIGERHEDGIVHEEKQSVMRKLGVASEDQADDEQKKALPVDFKLVRVPTMRDEFRICVEKMTEGKAKSLANAPLFFLPRGILGKPDILKKTDGRSLFGPHHYEVKEIKSAERITGHHEIQAAFYSMMIGHIQGRYPEKFYIINGIGQETEHAFADSVGKLERNLRSITEILQYKKMPEPAYGHTPYPWAGHGDSVAIKRRGISLIHGVGELKAGLLKRHGYGTIPRIASCNESKLAGVPGIGGSSARRFKLHAQAIRGGSPVMMEEPALPSRKTEIFMDFEGEMNNRRIYLIGMLVRKNGGERYSHLMSRTGEKRMWHRLLEFLRSQDDHVVYHWHSYEQTHIRRMGRKYKTPKDTLDNVLGRDSMVDLYKVATSSFAFPTYDRKLKSVAQHLKFRWKDPDINGANVGRLFSEYSRNPGKSKHILRKVLDYNEDDCRAAMVVKDWLSGHQSNQMP